MGRCSSNASATRRERAGEPRGETLGAITPGFDFMPLYEYECESCSKRFERIQKFSDPPIDVCALCGKGPVRKLPSSPAIQFKGTGWYITDYAKKSSTDAGSSKSGSSGDKTSDTGKSDSGEKKSDSSSKSDTSSSSSSTAKSEK
jgi:putative FmdB family regulatory protein